MTSSLAFCLLSSLFICIAYTLTSPSDVTAETRPQTQSARSQEQTAPQIHGVYKYEPLRLSPQAIRVSSRKMCLGGGGGGGGGVVVAASRVGS